MAREVRWSVWGAEEEKRRKREGGWWVKAHAVGWARMVEHEREHGGGKA